MRDIIWTLIIIWLIYKLVDMFKALNAKRSYANPQQQNTYRQTTSSQASATAPSKKDIKSAVQKHLNNEGEYVDFEEVK